MPGGGQATISPQQQARASSLVAPDQGPVKPIDIKTKETTLDCLSQTVKGFSLNLHFSRNDEAVTPPTSFCNLRSSELCFGDPRLGKI